MGSAKPRDIVRFDLRFSSSVSARPLVISAAASSGQRNAARAAAAKAFRRTPSALSTSSAKSSAISLFVSVNFGDDISLQ
jgi:hypothetical protein